MLRRFDIPGVVRHQRPARRRHRLAAERSTGLHDYASPPCRQDARICRESRAVVRAVSCGERRQPASTRSGRTTRNTSIRSRDAQDPVPILVAGHLLRRRPAPRAGDGRGAGRRLPGQQVLAVDGATSHVGLTSRPRTRRSCTVDRVRAAGRIRSRSRGWPAGRWSPPRTR